MGCPTPTFNYNGQLFRAMFPAFADSTTFPDVLLQMYWNTAGLYVQNAPDFLVKCGTNLQSMNLMTAHLAQLGVNINAGQASGVIVQATIDKISVGYQEAKLNNQWQYWLNSTEYGKQLLALLQVASVGGFYTPAGLGRAGFAC